MGDGLSTFLHRDQNFAEAFLTIKFSANTQPGPLTLISELSSHGIESRFIEINGHWRETIRYDYHQGKAQAQVTQVSQAHVTISVDSHKRFGDALRATVETLYEK